MSNFEALHPRAGGTGKNRTQFANKQYSDTGIPTLGAGPDLRVVMRGEQAVVMSVASEPSISLTDDLPRRDRPLDPITPEERARQESFNQQLQEAQEEFVRSRAKAAWALGEPSPAETGAGTSTRVLMRGEEAVVMSVATEPSISLSDELAKPRREAAQESASANAASWALGGPSPAEAKAKAADEAPQPRTGFISRFRGR